MMLKNWTPEENKYELKDGFILEKAESEEFAKFYVIYSNSNYFFSQSWDNSKSVIKAANSYYWIMKGNLRVGGVILRPNLIAKLFLIPPYIDAFQILKVIKPILLHWSDCNSSINAYEVLPKELHAYNKLGFRTGETRRCMIRPTQTFNVEWEDKYQIIAPNMGHKLIIAELFKAAYAGGVDSKKEDDENKHISFLEDYFNEEFEDKLINRASALVFDKNTNELAASCLISYWMGLPILEDIAVHPSYQGRGLGEKLIKRALSILNQKYDAMRLFVTIGNSAEALYYNIGFLPGEEFTNLYKTAE